jgi:hypothetical protein
METMFRRSLLRLSFLAAIFSFALASAGVHAQDNARKGRKYKVPPLSSRIEITILKDDNGKPVQNAAVIFHPIEGDKDKGALEMKSNEDGKAIIDVIPIGDTVRLQVIAKGFQTYGQDYKIDKAEMSMEVRLRRPGKQYSIYKNGPTASNGSGSDTAKPENPPQNAAPAHNDKESGPANQSDAKPNPESSQDQAETK